MKRYGWMAAMVSVMFLVGQAANAQDAAGPGKPKVEKKAQDKKKDAKVTLRGEYAVMAGVLKLNDETKAKVAEQVKANEQAMKEWTVTHAPKLKEARAEAVAAKKAKDQEKIAAANKKIKELEEAEAKLKADGKAKILALLTDDQKAVWAGFELRRDLLAHKFAGIKLTAEQTEQMQKLCEAAAKAMPAGEGEDAEKGRAEAKAKLVDEITQKVLTDEQRAKLQKKPAGKVEKSDKPKAKGAGNKDKGVEKPAAEAPKDNG